MKGGILISVLVAIVGSFICSGALIGTPIAEAAGEALSATTALPLRTGVYTAVAGSPQRHTVSV